MSSHTRASSHPSRSLLGRAPLLAAFILALLVGLIPGPPAEAEPQQIVLGYSIDRSAVPDWVTSQALTLRIEAPGVEQAWVFGDGLPVPFSHGQAGESLLVTTEASEIVVALAGATIEPELVGDHAVATLRDDKAWAYSLTFDDGRYTVYQYARPELAHYGYRSAVAVIGGWMDGVLDPVEWAYCTPEQVLELLDEGWGVFNHSYSHSQAPASITYEDALSCQEAIRNNLDGHEAIVFTVPYTAEAWGPIIDANVESLGLRLMQLVSDAEQDLPTGMHVVDEPIVLEQDEAFHLGRRDIDHWSFDGYNYFDQAHGMAPQHAWISLHGHDPDGLEPHGIEERCAIAESLSHLYHTYGPAGSDEVWMAPADQIFQYLVTRSYAVVTENPKPAVPEGMPDDPWRADEWVLYSPETSNVQEWSDTYIHQWYPEVNNETEGTLRLRGGAGRSSLLTRISLDPPDPDAVVIEARLSLYATGSSSSNAMDTTLYALNREWAPTEATWMNASTEAPWDQAGAVGANDRDPDPLEMAHAGACSQTSRWYTYDVTQQVASWLAQPGTNRGLLLEGQESISRLITFAGARHPDSNLKPRLYVRYGWPMPALPTSTATPTPEPSITPSPTASGTKLFLPLLCLP